MRKWLVAVLCLVFGGVFFQDAGALNFWEFNPGRIIDDAVFYDADAMTVAEIQRFLDSKVPVCETDWESHGYIWAAAPCLKDYKETTKTRPADQYCKEYVGGENQSAAQIIWGVGQACGINPQAILVILQKEQGLVTDTWPRDSWLNNSEKANFQYRSAMGYGCPDTAACDSEYYGFFNQVYYGSRQYKKYQASANSYDYRAGRNNNILWNPSRECGSSSVYIENQATAGLYNYTPYRPNDAALAAGWGMGNTCSSYGNRNFWAYFTNWFGSTYGVKWEDMATPRYLLIKKDSYKLNPVGGREITSQLVSRGTLVKFSSKTTIAATGALCLRTEGNTDNNYDMCVAYDDLEELVQPSSWTPLDSIKSMYLKQAVSKFDTSTSTTVEPLPKGLIVQFAEYSEYGGKTCMRTYADAQLGKQTCVLNDHLAEPDIKFEPMQVPRGLIVRRATSKYDTHYSYAVEPLPADLEVEFATMARVDGGLCLRTKKDTELDKQTCIRYDDLREKPSALFQGMVVPRKLTTRTATIKIDPANGNKMEDLPAGLMIDFAELAYWDGGLCLRTKTDVALNKQTCVLYNNLLEL